MASTQPLAQIVGAQATNIGRAQRSLAVRPGVEVGGEVDPTAVDQGECRHRGRVLRRESDHDVAAPRLADRDHGLECQVRAECGQVVGRGGGVVPVRR